MSYIPRPTEKRYEEYIERFLTSNSFGGLKFKSRIHQKEDTWYNKDLCIIEDEFIQFFKDTQLENYNTLLKKHGDSTDKYIISRVSQKINPKKDGVIKVLRRGVSEISIGSIKTLYFQPNRDFNKTQSENFSKNRFLLVRQLHYSPHSNKSIDIVLFLNGIPIITIELKNQLTGQTVLNSDHQYRFDRNPKNEPLLEFQRCLCHFSVDNDVVNMTTKLNGEETFFLPFNKTLLNKETISEGYKVSYLWEDILTPTSILNIIENFVLFTKETDMKWDESKGKVVSTTKDLLIFPRYHQLEVIRKLRNQILKDGVGTNYLIQHTTGSGKSYSIGWLSFMLIDLFKEDGSRMFDSVIIITDRKVLDRQLQNTVQSLEKVKGVVKKIDKDSNQLKDSLEVGSNIIVTTIQKFGVVVNRIKDLKGKSFGIIIDEVHSSQGGKGSKNVQKTLSTDEIEVSDDDINETISKIKREMKSRQKQDHISFFGFTGTPKPQTLEVFGTLQSDGSKQPFHSYTMYQSIGEKFTLDVLKSYTRVERWFELQSKSSEDVELPENKGKRELIKWVDSNPETISKKVEIIIDNLLKVTVPSINRRGKGMVIVRSIEDTVKFYHEMNKQLSQRGYGDKIKCLVGFSGKVHHNGEEVTEEILNKRNGVTETDIPTVFKNPLYRVLIVCNKFQTGFDEPLLHSMFIDKPLQGVQCVQTLSRLNRKTSGKSSTFILDFVNSIETIRDSFQNFYDTTILSEDTDPNLMYDVLDNIRNYGLFTPQEIDDWITIFFKDKRDDSQLQPTLNKVISRWEEFDTEVKDEIRSNVSNFTKLYGFLSMIHQFDNVELEKHYWFFEFLRTKFPVGTIDTLDVSNLVDLKDLTLNIKDKENISLSPETVVLNPSTYGTGGSTNEEEFDFLSEIIKEINEHFHHPNEEVDNGGKKFVNNLLNDDEVHTVVHSDNTDSNKFDKLSKIYSSKNIETLDVSTQLFDVLDSPEFKEKFLRRLISQPNILNQNRI
jgi:type I restriction enzyme, R subunit